MTSDTNFKTLQKQSFKTCTGDTSQIMEKLSWEKLKELYFAKFKGSVESYNNYIKSGVVAGKEWLADNNSCDICKENMRVGAIPLRAIFPSGHLLPHAGQLCRCALQPVVEGDVE